MADTTKKAEYISRPALAELLQVHPLTLLRWAHAGSGPPYIRNGKRKILYRRVDVDAWVDARRFRHTADEATRS